MSDFLNYGTSLELTQPDQQLIEEMSATICKQDRSYFVNNFKRDKTTTLYQMNLNGFGAELSFCRLCGVEFDSSTIQKESHFNNADAILKDGTTVDVKNTTYPNGRLIVRTGKESKLIDIYALVIGKFPVFKFSGWASYKDIIQQKLIVDLGWGDSYCLPQTSLRKSLRISAEVKNVYNSDKSSKKG
jgi:hypothetical protein|tara:strand:- start:428 stop:988 length:561 start_codon:yes stop_codon:yes gene_type:complete